MGLERFSGTVSSGDAIEKQLPRTKSQVDSAEIAEIARRFTKSFPHAESVRHGIAHAADKFKSPELMKIHGLKVSSYGPGFAIDAGGYLFPRCTVEHIPSVIKARSSVSP
jgi:hypothetical protein